MRKLNALDGSILTFVGMVAVVLGFGFIIAPDGQGFGLTVNLLENTPFGNYYIPGIVLVVVFGIPSLIVAILAFEDHKIAGLASMLLGFLIFILIVASVIWGAIPSGLQVISLIVGVAQFILGFLLMANHSKHKIFERYHGPHGI